MPKKSEKATYDLRDTFYDWAECRWEFQRRNKAYKLWWRQNRPKDSLRYPNPDFSFEKLIDEIGRGPNIFTENLVKKKCISKDDRKDIKPLLSKAFILLFTFPEAVKIEIGDEPSIMGLRIDFNKINSTPALIELVGLIISDYRRLLDQLNMCNAGKTQTYWKEWKRILVIGDMKREKKTRMEIAKELAKRGLIQPVRLKYREESVIRAISDDWKKYKELVKGGYLNIKYP